MKATMAAAVAKYQAWLPEALALRIKWRKANAQADQADIAAMEKAQRLQRKAGKP